MTLLIYAASAAEERGEASEMVRLAERVERDLGHCFGLLVTHEAPREIKASPWFDWVTLPASRSRQPEAPSVRMLRHYAMQFRPTVSIALGEALPMGGDSGKGFFGYRVLVGGAGSAPHEADIWLPREEYWGQLSSVLRRRVPASVVLKKGEAALRLEAAIEGRGDAPDLRLYWKGPIDAELEQALCLAEARFSGPIELQLGVREALLHDAGAAARALRAIGRHRRRVEVRLVSEVVPVRAQRAIGRGLKWLLRGRRVPA